MKQFCAAVLVCFATAGCNNAADVGAVVEPPGSGSYPVAATNLQVAEAFAGIGDEAMHGFLLGQADHAGKPRFLTDILAHPEAAWVVEVPVPDDGAVYGPAAGLTLPVAAFVVFPTVTTPVGSEYAFPYHDAQYGIFEQMLAPGEPPEFADDGARFPLVILSHGASAHGIYDVGHAHALAKHGYIVAVLNYGDERTALPDDLNAHLSFLRPLLTKAVVTTLLESETFGPHIDGENIGITGHSFGGFTALAMAGGRFEGNPASVTDERISAGVLAAPWVGGTYDGTEVYAFGERNAGLARVTAPMIAFFGTNDDVTEARYILPAMKQLSGPTYVVELVGQPHVFEGGSWQDRDNWELLFFNAYLKGDAEALETLKKARSMGGGNEDVQHFDYQRTH